MVVFDHHLVDVLKLPCARKLADHRRLCSLHVQLEKRHSLVDEARQTLDIYIQSSRPNQGFPRER